MARLPVLSGENSCNKKPGMGQGPDEKGQGVVGLGVFHLITRIV